MTDRSYSETVVPRCPNGDGPCYCTGACRKRPEFARIDAIGQNGGDGDHYGKISFEETHIHLKKQTIEERLDAIEKKLERLLKASIKTQRSN